MLLHLQGHDLFLLSVGQVVGSAPLRAAAPVDVMPALVLLVVKSSKGQNVEEEQGGSHSYGHRQLSGVVTLVHQVWLVVAVLGLSGEWSRVGTFGHQNLRLWGAVGSLWWRDLGGSRDELGDFIEAVQMRNQLQPQVDLVGTIVFFDAGLQANVQVKLVFLIVTCPCHFLKAIGFGVDELGVLGDWLVWVPCFCEVCPIGHDHGTKHHVIL